MSGILAHTRLHLHRGRHIISYSPPIRLDKCLMPYSWTCTMSSYLTRRLSHYAKRIPPCARKLCGAWYNSRKCYGRRLSYSHMVSIIHDHRRTTFRALQPLVSICALAGLVSFFSRFLLSISPHPPAAHNHRLGKEVETFHTLREKGRQRGRCAAARNDYRWGVGTNASFSGERVR